MSTKLYVGNLGYGVTEDQLRALFSEVGETDDVAVIMDRDTGRSRGFGFVEMSNDQAAQEAISRFNGYMLDGRELTVNVARAREERSGGGGRTGGGGRRNDDRRGGGGGYRRY
jgi:RNA recognition motif-containing protein